MRPDKPLFIPLKTEYYEAFANGTKKVELRRYGKRWHEGTCYKGREVVISKGYGKQNRMKGVISEATKIAGKDFWAKSRTDILAVYGTLDIDIMCISIKALEAIEEE